jgi:hypothetical protein
MVEQRIAVMMSGAALHVTASAPPHHAIPIVAPACDACDSNNETTDFANPQQAMFMSKHIFVGYNGAGGFLIDESISVEHYSRCNN